MVFPYGVIRHLLIERALEVIPKSCGVIEDSYDGINQLHFRHLAMGKLVVHKVLSLSLKGLAYLGKTSNLSALLFEPAGGRKSKRVALKSDEFALPAGSVAEFELEPEEASR